MQTAFTATPDIQLLMTLPGVGFILAVVIGLEVGAVGRFARAEKLAAYAGTTPRVHAGGGKTRFGPLRPDVNRYLKWAFIEAANAICIHRPRRPRRHVSRLYERIARRKGHSKAIGAVARHLAEATYWRRSPCRADVGPWRAGRGAEHLTFGPKYPAHSLSPAAPLAFSVPSWSTLASCSLTNFR